MGLWGIFATRSVSPAAPAGRLMNKYIDLESRYCAHNYHPLPVVLTHGEGVFVWDESGNKYLDMMSAYSAVSHGHANPRLVRLVRDQVGTLNIVSRAFYTDKLGPFLARACELTGQDKALPMNTGAEAVETAIKAARKWAYTVKGVADDKAEIIACSGNFHGRTTTIIAMSDEPQYKAGFGPFPAGFHIVEYGNVDALEAAINENTAAFLVEPIQGEGGIVVPPEGYLQAAAELCRKHDVLLIADEIQTGLGRTGKMLACEHEGITPDGLILGKALGGGIFPVSMFLARKDVMDVFRPGDHGSTFGGNPLGAAIGLEALNILVEDGLPQRSAELGDYLIAELRRIDSPLIRDIRGRGLFVGMEIDPSLGTARAVCEALMARGLLSKETHETVVRLAPPLVIGKQEIDWALQQIREVLAEMDRVRLAS
jgi:ornithine--oxo-acid transaminase